MRNSFIPPFGLLILCALLAGCGGSSGTAPTATTAASTRAATGAPAVTAPAAASSSAIAATSPAASAPASSAASTTAAPSAAGGTTVGVELKDFAITLDKSTINAGTVIFNVKNSGPSPHNFNMKINGEEKGVPTLDAGKAMTLTLDLKAGSYDFRCTIPGHDLLGMKGTLTVK